MTRSRALKQAVRTRAAKTGERYTTARRHILRLLNAETTPAAHEAPATTPDDPATGKATKPPVSDVKVRENTGHDLAYWFAVLDKFGAVDKGHTATARHLHTDHGVPGWYAQGITVAYERARGVRSVNQRSDGAYEVSVSKVVPADTATVVRMFTEARQRRKWIGDVNPDLAKALAAGLSGSRSKGFVIRSDNHARFRYAWDGTIVQFYLTPKGEDKVTLVVQHAKLAGAAAVEERRAQWKQAFASLLARL